MINLSRLDPPAIPPHISDMSIVAHSVWKIGVLVDRRRPKTKWGEDIWQAVHILPGAPDLAPWSEVERGDEYTRYYAGSATIELFNGETSTYKYNLESPVPSIYTVLRKTEMPPGLRLQMATVCPGEAHAHADTGDDLVEALAMPDAVRVWLEAFVAKHHKEQTFFKRTRDRADPESLARRRHLDEDDGGR